MNEYSKAIFASELLPRFWKHLDKSRKFEDGLKLYQSIFLSGKCLQSTTPNTIVMEVLDFCLEKAEFIQNTADIVLAAKDYCKVKFLPNKLKVAFEIYLVECYVKGDPRIVELFESL